MKGSAKSTHGRLFGYYKNVRFTDVEQAAVSYYQLVGDQVNESLRAQRLGWPDLIDALNAGFELRGFPRNAHPLQGKMPNAEIRRLRRTKTGRIILQYGAGELTHALCKIFTRPEIRLPEDVVVYRGISLHIEEATGFQWGFTSTTLDADVALRYAGIYAPIEATTKPAGIVRIRVPKGTPALYVPAISYLFRKDRELLLPPGIFVEVTSSVRSLEAAEAEVLLSNPALGSIL